MLCCVLAGIVVPALVPRGPAMAQQRAAPRIAPPPPGCDAATAEPVRDMALSFGRVLPFAREILAHHDVSASFEGRGRQARIELRLRDVRDLELPEGHPGNHLSRRP